MPVEELTGGEGPVQAGHDDELDVGCVLNEGNKESPRSDGDQNTEEMSTKLEEESPMIIEEEIQSSPESSQATLASMSSENTSGMESDCSSPPNREDHEEGMKLEEIAGYEAEPALSASLEILTPDTTTYEETEEIKETEILGQDVSDIIRLKPVPRPIPKVCRRF